VQHNEDANDARYRLITDNLPVLVSYIDADCRYQIVNKAYTEWFGGSDVDLVGRRVQDVLGPIAYQQREPFLRRVLAGEPVHFVGPTPHQDGSTRETEMSYVPHRNSAGRVEGFVVLGQDLSGARQAEARNRFLVKLDDALRPLSDPAEIKQTAASVLGRHLGVNRCAYAEVEDDEDTFDLTGDYTNGVPSIVGRYKLSAFGEEALRLNRADLPFVVSDSEQEVPPEQRHVYRATHIRAVISMPLHKGGKFVAGMAVHQNVPRRWTDSDLELLRLVANRCWESFARARIARGLEESEARYRLVNRATNDVIWDWNLDSNELRWNEALENVFGHRLEQVPPTIDWWSEQVHAEDRERVLSHIHRVIREGGNAWQSEYRFRRADGTYAVALDRGYVARDAQGRATRMVGSMLDETPRLAAERAMRASEERFRSLVTATAQMVWTTEPDGRVVEDSPSWRRFTGQTVEEWKEFGWLDALHPDDRERVGAVWRECLATKSVCEVEYRVRAADGVYRWTAARAVPVLEADGRIREWIGTNTDVTERVETEQERNQLLESERHARAEAERANRLKDDFLATLSHELRTPLNSILGWAQMLSMQGDMPGEALHGLHVIERNARTQVRLIEDLLDMSRIMSGKLRLELTPVAPSAVVRGALESLTPAAQAKGIALHVQIQPDLPLLRGDAARLQQVVWNLISNGIKFSAPGGRVDVALRSARSQMVELLVTDRGVGIEPEFLPFVFERFRQADGSTTRKHGGLGLGLAIVRSIVESHGGTVWAESEGAGQGATLTVQLPVHALAEESPEPEDESSALFADERLLEGVTVLVVDDQPDAREIVEALLQTRHATVVLATDAAEAYRLLGSVRPDVLVSDIGMPKEDGYSLIRRVRELPPERGGNTPAAALTAFSRSEDRRRALLAGYQSHIPKPVDAAELIAVVASLAGRLGPAAGAPTQQSGSSSLA
jgi:PAS domain S-box-containing protein